MATIVASHEAKMILHRIATARTRAIHNNDRLYRAAVEAVKVGRANAKLTPAKN